jgi:glutathione-regulated potassium-efflux system ancillary protein KefC/glutathione-regulated potassium-efflux system protein KefB
MSPLAQSAIFLLAVVIAVPVFRRLRLGAVLAYLTAGVVIGPWGLGAATDVVATMHLAEFGVVLLLFVIGLELQPSRLRVMRKAVLGVGGMQVGITTTILTLAIIAFGRQFNAAFTIAFALSLSSTPLVLQLLAERGQLNTHHGRTAFAVLLFQDIAVMPVLAVLPLLSPSAVDHDASATMFALAKGVGVLLLLVFGGRYVLRPVLRIVAETHVSEAFTAVALLVVIGTALLASAVGLSMALGAFVAGLLLADSEYRHELEADIEPFKGLLLGLFFISVGMSANLGLVLAKPLLIVTLVVVLLTVKIAISFAVAKWWGLSGAAARSFALALSQAGEFGFVLFSLATANGILSRDITDLLVVVVTLSMAATPLLMVFEARVLEPRLSPAKAPEFDRIEDDGSRVIIAGFGRFGQVIARVLRMRHIRFTALESSAAQVDFVRQFGNKIYYGDASRLDLLQAAGAQRAEVLVLAIDDVEASVRTAELIKRHYPHLKIFARARNRQHALRLMEIGVRYLIRETFLSSLEMSQYVLRTLGLSPADAAESIKRFRKHDELALQSQLAFKDDEQKLIQTSQQAARELEQLFAADAREEQVEEQAEAVAR